MTKVTYIHGLQLPKVPADERRDRGKEVPRKGYINYTAMTEGETRLALLREQVRILKAYYPEVRDLAIADELITNALETGLHGISYMPGNGAAFARKAIQQAKKNTKPAAGIFIGRRRIDAGLGDLITLQNCNNYLNPNSPQYSYENYQKCVEANKNKELLNEHLEDSSHHMLYEYAGDLNSRPAVVAAKGVNHRNVVSRISEMLEFGRGNMVYWMRNGVMRNNAKNGTEPYQPEDTITALSDSTEYPGLSGTAGIGVFPFAAVAAIIGAIASAIAATAGFVQAMKPSQAQQLRQIAQGIGTPTWGPEGIDWGGGGSNGEGGGSNGGGGGSNSGGGNNSGGADSGLSKAAPIIIGAGLLLLATSK